MINVRESLLVKTITGICEGLSSGISRMRLDNVLAPEILNSVVNTAIDCPEKPTGFESLVKGTRFLGGRNSDICLVSGGADSTIQWFLADSPPAIYVNFGQPYAEKEIEALEAVGVTHDIIEVEINNPIGYWKHIIPGRNLLLLTIAAELLQNEGVILFGVTDGEGWNSEKGDKSCKFVIEFTDWYNTVTDKGISVETMATRTKAGWLKEFKSQGFDPDVIRYKTITCFSSKSGQCGECQACLRKYLSFVEAFSLDTSEDYKTHPMEGAKQYVDKYKKVLAEALGKLDFSHYSEDRCREDLHAIEVAEKWMVNA